MVYVFLGAPGSGKGTQAKMLESNNSFVHLSTGDMLRTAVAKGTELGQKVKSIMERGELVSDAIVLELIKSSLASLPPSAKVILDGYPRNKTQAIALGHLLDDMGVGLKYVVYFDVEESDLVQRLVGRRSCPKCGASYHLKYSPPKRNGVCDQCGFIGELTHRSDDNEATVRERLKVFRDKTSELIGYYRDLGILRAINAGSAPNLVRQQIQDLLVISE